MKIETEKSYCVRIEDCCVEGEFASKLLKIQCYDDEEKPYFVNELELDYGTILFFENGVTLRAMGGVVLEECANE